MKIKKNPRILYVFLILLVFAITGCGKKGNAPIVSKNNVGQEKYNGVAETQKNSLNSRIIVQDQELIESSFVINKIKVLVLGWIVIHNDENGKPGLIIGKLSMKPGDYSNIKILVDYTHGTSKLYAMLHDDKGVLGVFEYPGADTLSKDKDKDVMTEFNVLLKSKEPENFTGKTREIKMTAKIFAFDPANITVNKGDKVKLIITTKDIDHSIEIPTFNVKKIISIGYTTTVEFIADKAGIFPFFSYINNGPGNENMKGTIIVK